MSDLWVEHEHQGHAVHDADAGLFHFACPCGTTNTYHVDDLELVYLLGDTEHGAVAIECPHCGTVTGLVTNIPEDHPHQSAPHIRALVHHLRTR